MATGAAWCGRCHHMLVLAGGRQYAHYSDDDWTGDDCGCAVSLVRCQPEVTPYALFSGLVSAAASACAKLTLTVSSATGQWASLASATAEPEE